MQILNRLPEQGTFGFFGGVFVGSVISTVIWWTLFIAALAAIWSGK